MPSFGERIRNSWNAFMGRDPTPFYPYMGGYGSGLRPDRYRARTSNIRSVVTAVYNQIAVDVSMVDIRHVRLDEENKFKEVIDDSLNKVLNKNANIDQTGRALIQDLVQSMFDEGCVALFPVETDIPPYNTDSYNVLNARVAKIVEWYPQHVRLSAYNERTGRHEEVTVEKRICPIIENPFYSTMNEPNAIAQRLIRILNQLDRTNEQNSAGKIDLLVQLPFAVKSEGRMVQAEERRKTLEAQLTGSQYGIGYIDASERVIQLNRSVENNLWTQAVELQKELFNQLGFSEKILDGTADEATMINYHNRSIAPILTAITEEIERKWLSPTAISQKQAIRFFKDPFKLVPVSQLAEISDKFTRNEIMSSNEIRAKIGLAPSNDPKADELRNSNLNHPDEQVKAQSVNSEDKLYK